MTRPYFDRITPEELSGEALDLLLSLGWYRMHQSLFTCSHVELGALHRVHWLRYHVPEIKSSPTQKRIRTRTKDFKVTIEEFSSIPEEHVELHARYRAAINFDGALSIEECLFGDEPASLANIFLTQCISVYDKDRLIAGGYFDLGENSAASILHFFDPDYARFSLGKLLILHTIDYLREHHVEWYYPGYVVQGLTKMNYKLFLGKEAATYFVPEHATWKRFTEDILIDPPELSGSQATEK